ncbi:MAG: S8 family serine peptidase, partial [Bacteroidota bacterium]
MGNPLSQYWKIGCLVFILTDHLTKNPSLMRLNLTKVTAVAVAVIFLGACTEEFRQEVRKAPAAPTAEYVPGELLIQLKSGGTSGSRIATSVLAEIEGELVENLVTPAMKSTAARSGSEAKTLILAKSNLGTMEAIAKLQGNPEVQFAEPNYIYHHFATSNDTYYTNGSLLGMYGSSTSPANQFGCGAGTAWLNEKTDCSSVVIGIIDEGYMYTHDDLAANAYTNPGEIAGDGKDNDGNGYIDDIYGWDFAGNNNSV